MGKRKKTSTEIQQSTLCTQDNEVKLQDKTSQAQVWSEKATEETSTKTKQNINNETYLNSQSTNQVIMSNLTTTASQTQNYPSCTNTTEPCDSLHSNKKCLPSTSVMNQCPVQPDADEHHENAYQRSAKRETNIILAQDKSLSSVTSETEMISTSNASTEAEMNVKALALFVVQENETASSTQKLMRKNLDSNTTLNNRTPPTNITPREFTSQGEDYIKTSPLRSSTSKERTEYPVATKNVTSDQVPVAQKLIPDFPQSQDTIMLPHSTSTEEKTMKTRNKMGNKKNGDQKEKPHTLLVRPQLKPEKQDLEQTAGPTNEIITQKQNVTGEEGTRMEIINEKLHGSRVSQCGPQLPPAETITNTNTDKRHPTKEVSKGSCSLALHDSLSNIFSEKAADNPVRDTYSITAAATAAPQLPDHKKTDPPSLIEKQSSPQVTQVAYAEMKEKSTSPMQNTVEMQIKSDLIHDVGMNVDPTSRKEEDGISSKTSQSSPTYSGLPTKMLKDSLSQQVGELGKEVKALSTPTVMQGSTSTEDSHVSTNTSQATCICSVCPIHVSSSAQLSKEAPVHSSTVQGSANKEEFCVGNNTLQSTQKPTITNHRAKVAKVGRDVPVLSPTTNNGADSVSVTSNMIEQEAFFAVKEKNAALKVCVQAENTEMSNGTNKDKKTKQHMILDTQVSKISPSAVPKPEKNMGGISKGLDTSIKQTGTQKKSPISTISIADMQVDAEVITKKDDSAYKTQDMHETDKTSLNTSKEIPTRTSTSSTSFNEKSAEKNDDQNPDMKLETKEDYVLRDNLMKVTIKSRRKSKSSDKTLDSKRKSQENKGTYTSLTCVSNQLCKSKEECRAITRANTTTGPQQSPNKANSANDDADEKLRNKNAEEENNTTILGTEESYNKVRRRKRKSAKDKQIQNYMNPQSSRKLKQNCSTDCVMQGSSKNQTNENSVSRNKQVEENRNENTQHSNTDSPATENNTDGINEKAQEETKNYRKNGRKKKAQEGNETDLRAEDYAASEEYLASELRDYKDEKTQPETDPKTLQGEEEKTEISKSEDILTGPNANISTRPTQANKKVSTALSKQHLINMARRETSEMTFVPDVTSSPLTLESTNSVSTVDDEAETEHKMVQREIFLSYVCHVCKSLESFNCRLKKCSNCKMISYCSKEHQRQHWPAHKNLCKVISNICKCDRITNLFQKAVGISPDQYRSFRYHYVNECANKLGRELDLWEKEMIYYPQVCHTCYEFDIQKLTTCQKCHHVSHCKPSHLKTDHDIWCKEFQLFRDTVLYQFHYGIIQPSIPERVLKHYAPLAGNIKTFMLNTAGVSNQSLFVNRLNLTALTDIATCPLTVLFSLQKSNFALEDIKSLTIHLVGAEIYFEVYALRKWESLLLHLIPSLRNINVVFVGPELNIDNEFLQTVDKITMCRKCNTAGRKVVYGFWKGLYHDFLNSKNYKKPDLISAFNAGLYRLTDFEGKDTWSPTIEAMLKEPDIPVVVTEYTEQELPYDLQRIQGIVDSLEIIMPPAKNPFASSKPSLNFFSEETVPVIFKNFCITILKGGKKVKETEENIKAEM
jgi:splicing suppressor protein 51